MGKEKKLNGSTADLIPADGMKRAQRKRTATVCLSVGVAPCVSKRKEQHRHHKERRNVDEIIFG